VVVAVRRRVQHPRYRKYIQVTKRYMAHDERNACQVGDRVEIYRPLQRKRDARAVEEKRARIRARKEERQENSKTTR